MNPVDETRLERLYDLLELKPNARVADVGCGKGEMLIRLALAHPEDTNLEELLARDSKERESYLKWGRDALGWAIYLFRKMR